MRPGANAGSVPGDIESTRDIPVPPDPLMRVIGQDEAVEVARVAASQRRHLLLVGPPGTGKSMIAQAITFLLPPPEEEVRIVHNPANPERPGVQILKRSEVLRERAESQVSEGETIHPKDAPESVAIRLGYLCSNCRTYSHFRDRICPKCGKVKAPVPTSMSSNPFADVLTGIFEVAISQFGPEGDRVTSTRKVGEREEVVAYERADDMILLLDENALKKRRELERLRPRKVLLPLERRSFIMATGASETELLGDVRHDPYGGHPQLGVPPYERVVPGAIHEAHEGVLFIDEIHQLRGLQRGILTAMQDGVFPISGRNPQSAGASVRVDNVPCDFIFVGACNIQDVVHILSPLRSRITGCGYEVLLETTMPDDDVNRGKLAQFVAQEIMMDGRIPHAGRDALAAIVDEARRRARSLDGKNNALTLRLRELGGLIRAAGDLAVSQGAPLIRAEHITAALKRSRPIEDLIRERHGSMYGGVARDVSDSQRESMPYYHVDEHMLDKDKSYW